MSIVYATLAADLTARGYSAASDPQAVATAMNGLAVSTVVHAPVNERSLMGAIGSVAAAGIVTALTSGSANGMTLGGTAYPAALFGLFLRQLQAAGSYAQPGGLDAGDLEFGQFVGLMAGAGLLTADQATAVTALGIGTAGYVQATYGVPALTAADVIVAFGGSAVTRDGGN